MSYESDDVDSFSRRYTDGSYADENNTWHQEDSAWKAAQVASIVEAIGPIDGRVVDVGCGVGEVILELSQMPQFRSASFAGYDISPMAISVAAAKTTDRIGFTHGSAFDGEKSNQSDLVLCLDVFEHVSDYLGFLASCRRLNARAYVFHIPLDLHASSVVRGVLPNIRRKIGHLHYFTAETALATLTDSGFLPTEVRFTDGALALADLHPSFQRRIANVARRAVSKISTAAAARLFGGYSLLVLAR